MLKRNLKIVSLHDNTIVTFISFYLSDPTISVFTFSGEAGPLDQIQRTK